jgi:hypothetical protein
LATDERSEEGITYLKEHGVVLFNDLITYDERREFGWGLLFSDVIAVVEQRSKGEFRLYFPQLTLFSYLVIGHGAGYFYGHVMSSVCVTVFEIVQYLTAP